MSTKNKISEEIGRNYSTRGLYNDKPYSWADNTDLDIDTYVTNDGGWAAQVKCISKPELSTSLQKFKDQHSAEHWTRKQVDRITRATLNEIKIRKIVRNILLNAL